MTLFAVKSAAIISVRRCALC